MSIKGVHKTHRLVGNDAHGGGWIISKYGRGILCRVSLVSEIFFYSPTYAFYQIITSSSQVDFGSQEGPVMEEKSGHESGAFMPIKRLFKDWHVTTIALVGCQGGNFYRDLFSK